MRTRARSSSKSPRSQLPGNTAVRPQENVPRQRQTSKRGYCELCDVTFKSLRSHVVGKEHRSNASKGDRFAGVDRLIRRGRTLEEFVADVRTRKASSNKETKWVACGTNWVLKRWCHKKDFSEIMGLIRFKGSNGKVCKMMTSCPKWSKNSYIF